MSHSLQNLGLSSDSGVAGSCVKDQLQLLTNIARDLCVKHVTLIVKVHKINPTIFNLRYFLHLV